MKPVKTVLTLVLGIGVLMAAGCGKNNAPCNTDPSQIQSARSELNSAEESLTAAKADLDEAKAEKTKLEGQMRALPEPAELESKLKTLKKGSGR